MDEIALRRPIATCGSTEALDRGTGEVTQRIEVALSECLDQRLEQGGRRIVEVGHVRGVNTSVEAGLDLARLGGSAGRLRARPEPGRSTVPWPGTYREMELEQRIEGGAVLRALDQGCGGRPLDHRPVRDIEVAQRSRRVEHLRGRHRDTGLTERMHQAEERREQQRRCRWPRSVILATVWSPA